MNHKNVLVFPCGSEVALEIHRSLQHNIHVNLIGGNSTNDHGKFQFENYHGDFPYYSSSGFLKYLKRFIHENKIDAIYPATDNVIATLKSNEKELNCIVISSPKETAKLCSSKIKTYSHLKNEAYLPVVYENIEEITEYPVFIKPDIGHSSIGAEIINSSADAKKKLKDGNKYIITEYLPGKEYTVDCFTNRLGDIQFIGPRPRNRTKSGISVNSISIQKKQRREFETIAHRLNELINFQGAWFFQLKRDLEGKLKLLEIASRMGGSSCLYRLKGVNFALLSIYDAFSQNVSLIENDYTIEIDRAISLQANHQINFQKVYIDYDDCLIIRDKVNAQLVCKLYEFINNKKIIILITRHKGDLNNSLKKNRLSDIFDKVIHIQDRNRKKSEFISTDSAIFIDDSFSERSDVKINCNIPVFAPDMINNLK